MGQLADPAFEIRHELFNPDLSRKKKPYARGVAAFFVVMILMACGAFVGHRWDGTRAFELDGARALQELLDRDQGPENRKNAGLRLYRSVRKIVYHTRDIVADPKTPPELSRYLEGLLKKVESLPTRELPSWWRDTKDK